MSNGSPEENDLRYTAALHRRAGHLMLAVEVQEARVLRLLAEVQRQEARTHRIAARVQAMGYPEPTVAALNERLITTRSCLARSCALATRVHQSLQKHWEDAP